MRNIAGLLITVAVVLAITGGPALAQKRTTLFDLLFGNQNNQQQAQPQQPAAPQAITQPARPSPSVTVIAAPAINKNENATRLMVIGDSLAIDLAKALERYYAEDPNLIVIDKGVGSSGFVRDDYYDWNAALKAELDADSFDIAVVILGINDRQAIGRNQPLSEEWKTEYSARLNTFLTQFRAAGKPVLWVGLPPMRSHSYSQAISEISSLQRLAVAGSGADFVDIYERFTDELGNYSEDGPDINGQTVRMRKSDGIHFSNAGSDKVAFYVNQTLRRYYRGGAVSIEVADPLDGTDAATLLRPPFQGQGQIRLLEVAGAIMPLNNAPPRATELVVASPDVKPGPLFSLEDLVAAPEGRADAFGVGIAPTDDNADEVEGPMPE
ncbi:MAG: DUF459 domain-containing protein [Hyphomicrobiaceae bacterium]|nr:DUF459 domain-containing protein [Hyphomicrobiaceae bacterium]